jgi:hypothetical protein
MKNFYKLIWIIAVIGFVAVSCGNWFGGDDNDEDTSVSGGGNNGGGGGDGGNNGPNGPGSDPTPNNPDIGDGFDNNATVYVSGRYGDNPNTYACYWENETRKDLRIAGTGGYTSGITVHSGNVYISGGFGSDGSPIVGTYWRDRACYWKDGTRIDLPIPDGTQSITTGISVHGGNVYVSGIYGDDYYSSSYSGIACYWKDGTKIDLPIPDGTQSRTTGISVQDGNVYVSGIYGDDSGSYFSYNNGATSYFYGIACYWKDGTKIDLPIPDGTESITTGISVQGGNVYVSGVYKSDDYYSNSYSGIACYWKDGSRIDLTSGGTGGTEIPASVITTGISVQGGNVYVSGGRYGDVCYWENGNKIDLDSGSYSSGIAVQGGIVYVSGVYRSGYPGGGSFAGHWESNTSGRYPNLMLKTNGFRSETTGIAVVSQ